MSEVPLSGPIVVAGDITVDWLTWTEQEAVPALNPDDDTPNWRRHQITRRVARAGGAMLLARMLTHIPPRRQVIARYDPARWQPQHSHQFVESFIELKENLKRFEIAHLRGFGGPESSDADIDAIPKVIENPSVLVLDDAGNGFRKSSPSRVAKWDTWLNEWHPEWIVLKLSRPLGRTGDRGLWERLRPIESDVAEKSLIPPDRLVVIVNADDLREHGIKLTPRLSWERTAEDFVRNIVTNGKLATLMNCRHLLVRFGGEATIHFRFDKRSESFLYYDPRLSEGDIVAGSGGRSMIGLTAAFTAAIAADIATRGTFMADIAVRRAMHASAALAVDGFRRTAGQAPDYDLDEVFKINRQPHKDDEKNIKVFKARIPSRQIVAASLQPVWRILENRGDFAELARRVVVQGVEAALGAPVARYGDLVTADRREIEAIRAISNLLHEYIRTPAMTKPLSIAVFGPPGSGKSFTVKQIARQLPDAGKRTVLEFNLSQFNELTNLTGAFRRIQDCILKSDIPLVFFDEFDVSLKQEKLGWLKYFLAPMHDGEFRDGEVPHSLGRAIFVFAGGTCKSFREFSKLQMPEGLAAAFDAGHREHADAKKPDFLSRLRGYVDIMGVEASDDGNDHSWPVRRAIPLRYALSRRAPTLLGKRNELAIDEGVLHAFLTIPKFHHGVRSIEAILDMCALTHAQQFTPSCLPAIDQLDLHVDAEEFMDRVRSERLDPHLRVELGIRIHEEYRAMRRSLAGNDPDKLRELANDTAMVSWSALDPVLRESNCQQADAIPRRLRRLNMYMAQYDESKRDQEVPELPHDKIDQLAEMEHERFIEERLARGWQSGPRDPARQQTPFLVPWSDVTEYYKNYDRNSVRKIPDFLKDVGYRVYRMPKIDLP